MFYHDALRLAGKDTGRTQYMSISIDRPSKQSQVLLPKSIVYHDLLLTQVLLRSADR